MTDIGGCESPRVRARARVVLSDRIVDMALLRRYRPCFASALFRSASSSVRQRIINIELSGLNLFSRAYRYALVPPSDISLTPPLSTLNINTLQTYLPHPSKNVIIAALAPSFISAPPLPPFDFRHRRSSQDLSLMPHLYIPLPPIPLA